MYIKNRTVHLRYLNLYQLVRVELLETTEGNEERLTQTYVMTSFRDSMAFSSVILSGLSSDVCFFMSVAIRKGVEKKIVCQRLSRRWKERSNGGGE